LVIVVPAKAGDRAAGGAAAAVDVHLSAAPSGENDWVVCHQQQLPIAAVAELIPAIHAISFDRRRSVDARHKSGHDGSGLRTLFGSL
jgi:hypothetical protein